MMLTVDLYYLSDFVPLGTVVLISALLFDICVGIKCGGEER